MENTAKISKFETLLIRLFESKSKLGSSFEAISRMNSPYGYFGKA